MYAVVQDIIILAMLSGIHAREWISSATVTYILNKLLTSDNPVIQDLARSFDYYVFPIVNPDGYVYTHTTVIAPLCFRQELNRVIVRRLSYY